MPFLKGGETVVIVGDLTLEKLLIVVVLMSIILGGPRIYRHLQKHKREKLLSMSGIRDIDKMDGRQFEFFLEVLFNKLGYRAEVTPGSRDYGADIILKGKNKIVVQAKRYGAGNKVGLKAVMEAHFSKSYYNAQDAWVITNSRFTSSAIEGAKKTGVKLMDRTTLQEFILKINPERKPADIRKEVRPASRKCPKCGKDLSIRQSKDGQQFFGCSSFPQCKHTENIAN